MRHTALLGIAVTIFLVFLAVNLTDKVAASGETITIEPHSHYDKRLEFTSVGTYTYEIDIIMGASESGAYILQMDDINYHQFISGQPYTYTGYQAIGGISGSGSSTITGPPGVQYLVFVNDGDASIEIDLNAYYSGPPIGDIAFFAIDAALGASIILFTYRSIEDKKRRWIESTDTWIASLDAQNRLKDPKLLIFCGATIALIISYIGFIFFPLNGQSRLELLLNLSPALIVFILLGGVSFFVGLWLFKMEPSTEAISREILSFTVQLAQILLLMEGGIILLSVLFPVGVGLTSEVNSGGPSLMLLLFVISASMVIIVGGLTIDRHKWRLLTIISTIVAITVNPVLGIPIAILVYLQHSSVSFGSKRAGGLLSISQPPNR